MNNFTKALISGILLGAASQAMAINIGGLELPNGRLNATGEIYTNAPTLGGELFGYGRINSFNSALVTSLCTDCELTFRFGGYTFSGATPSEATFSGGWVNVYLGFGSDKDFSTNNGGGSAGDLLEASNGTLFLSLTGHDIGGGNTFISTGTNIGTSFPNTAGHGLLDVDTSAGGIANSYFNGNGITATGGNADVNIGSVFPGFSPAYAGDCASNGPGCLRGAVFLDVSPIPEPEVYALMVAGLGLVGFAAHRRRKN